MTHLVDTSEVETLFFGELQARHYQISSMRRIENAFVNQGAKRVCLVSPTGSGKTVNCGIMLCSPIIRKFVGLSNETDSNGQYIEKLRVLYIAHRDRLLSQAVITFADANGAEIIPQSMFSDIPVGVIERGWHITIEDECHHESTTSFQNKLEQITQNSKHHLGFVPFIGMTATEERADGFLIKFDTIITAISREQAVDEGWLAKTYLYSFVDATSRDNKVPLLSDIFKDFHHRMGRGIAFVSTKAEASELARAIVELTGKRAIDISEVSDVTLNTVLNQFSVGEWDFIVNCNKLGEGIDVKGCESVIIGRSVNSYPYLNQLIGRGSRPDSDCRVWELVNPLKDNMDSTVVVGIPEEHNLIYKRSGKWVEKQFDYSTLVADESFSTGSTNRNNPVRG